MTPGNHGQPDPPPASQAGTWPPPASQAGTWPPPVSQAETWPPPPTGQPFGADAAALTVPFKSVPRRASVKELRKALYSDFREGVLQVGPAGLSVRGKAVLRAEVRVPIFIVALVIVRFLGLIAYLLMEYAFRQDAAHQVAWDAVRLVQIAPEKRQACVVYDAPNYKGVVRTFSLAFSLDAAAFPAFAQEVRQFVPDRLADGNLKSTISVRVWIRLIVLLLFIAFAVVAAVTRHH